MGNAWAKELRSVPGVMSGIAMAKMKLLPKLVFLLAKKIQDALEAEFNCIFSGS
jgi:hypothetical protein